MVLCNLANLEAKTFEVPVHMGLRLASLNLGCLGSRRLPFRNNQVQRAPISKLSLCVLARSEDGALVQPGSISEGCHDDNDTDSSSSYIHPKLLLALPRSACIGVHKSLAYESHSPPSLAPHRDSKCPSSRIPRPQMDTLTPNT